MDISAADSNKENDSSEEPRGLMQNLMRNTAFTCEEKSDSEESINDERKSDQS